MFETKSGVLLIAGLGFFGLAFLSNAVVPWLMYRDDKEKTVEELVNANVVSQFQDLSLRYPEAFARHIGAPPPLPGTDAAPAERQEKHAAREAFFREKCADALRQGRDVYVGEACWHCHSQFVRPVSNESRRWGPVAKSWEYNNELQRPVMFGTRRVGPDLSREGGRRGNDWHFIHFYRPRLTTPDSVMPDYPWFFEGRTETEVPGEEGRPQRVEGPTAPNRHGFAIITYMQWLGSWLDSYPTYRSERVPYRLEEKHSHERPE
jgi:hypothetical protein